MDWARWAQAFAADLIDHLDRIIALLDQIAKERRGS
jgi:hypothetical protein